MQRQSASTSCAQRRNTRSSGRRKSSSNSSSNRCSPPSRSSSRALADNPGRLPGLSRMEAWEPPMECVGLSRVTPQKTTECTCQEIQDTSQNTLAPRVIRCKGPRVESSQAPPRHPLPERLLLSCENREGSPTSLPLCWPSQPSSTAHASAACCLSAARPAAAAIYRCARSATAAPPHLVPCASTAPPASATASASGRTSTAASTEPSAAGVACPSAAPPPPRSTLTALDMSERGKGASLRAERGWGMGSIG